MVRLFLGPVLFMASLGFGAERTTIEFPFAAYTFVNHKEVKLTAAKLNAKLKEHDLDGIPATIVVTEGAAKYWRVIMKRLEAGNQVLPTEVLTPLNSGYFYEYPRMCYRGDIDEVPGILKAMRNNFLNGDQAVLALKYGAKSLVRSDEFKSKAALLKYHDGNNAAEVKAWLEYDEASDKVLVMSNLGPQGDGTELYATFIGPCK